MTDGPPDLSPREAVDRWLDRARLDRTESTVASYRRRLRHFVEWCEGGEGDAPRVSSLADLDPWDIEAFEDWRRGHDVAPITLNNELTTLRQLMDYACRLDLVDEAVVEAIDPPQVSPENQTDDTHLPPERGVALLRTYRDGEDRYTREHALLELTWWTGARMGALRGLDLDDVDLDEGYVQFVHRPEEGTPLKNGLDGERIVGISDDVVTALREYIRHERPDSTDEFGRRPLFATEFGRATHDTFRSTCYYATVPCRVGPCPHGKERPTCSWYTRTSAYGCPSSRSPHQVRSGSIMWQLNRGLRADVVADRVNAEPRVIERFYDKARQLTEFRERREEHLDKLGLDDQNTEENAS